MKRTASINPGFVLGSHPSKDLSIQVNYRVHIRVTVGFRKLQSAAWAFSVYKKTFLFLFLLVFEPVYISVRIRRPPVNAIPGETDSFMCAPATNNYLRPLIEGGIQKLITYTSGTKMRPTVSFPPSPPPILSDFDRCSDALAFQVLR